MEATIFYLSLALVFVGRAFLTALYRLPEALFAYCMVRGVVYLVRNVCRKEVRQLTHKEKNSHDTVAALSTLDVTHFF